jgi:D-amino-acid dehydrogenase
MALRRGAGAAIAALGGVTAFRYNQVTSRESNLPTNELASVNWSHLSASEAEESHARQRVVIVGAGVVGVSTAYKLARRGHQVVVLEPRGDPGEECSACAAGGMSRQNVVVDKSTWNAVLKSVAPRLIQRVVLGTPEDFQFFQIDWLKSLSDPFFLRWAWTFTRTSLFPDHQQNQKQKSMLQFTDFAVQDMVNLLEDPTDDMAQKAGYNTRGSLAVSYEKPRMDSNDTVSSDPKRPSLTLEPNRRIDSTKEVLRLEPSLTFQTLLPVSAKFEFETKSASSGRFAKELARRCREDPKLDVTFVHNTKVLGASVTKVHDLAHNKTTTRRRITELRTNNGVLKVDDAHVVITAGAWTPHVLSLMDLYAPVYPLKGYALSVSASEALEGNATLQPDDLPSRIVCDKFMYTTRLGDEIRFTSIGEFSEWDTRPTKHVDRIFRNEAMRQFPQLTDLIKHAPTFCGHRPYVSDGILLLGACTDAVENLYVSCGPGSNGWKLAFGSGEVIARLISGQTTSQIRHELGFDADDFSPANRVVHAPMFARICRARWNV